MLAEEVFAETREDVMTIWWQEVTAWSLGERFKDGGQSEGFVCIPSKILPCLIVSMLVLMGRRSGGDFVADVPSDQRFQRCLNECN